MMRNIKDIKYIDIVYAHKPICRLHKGCDGCPLSLDGECLESLIARIGITDYIQILKHINALKFSKTLLKNYTILHK